jgi:protein O-mannosyl-transferase
VGSPALVFHVAEILLNAICSALAVVLVIGPLFKDAPITKIVAALLYAVHPVKTEAVAGVVGMAELLSACFFFVAVYLFAERQSPVLSGLVCFLASMCKETGITAVLVVAVIGCSRRRYVSSAVAVVVAVSLFVFIRLVAFGSDSWTIEPSPQDNPMMMQRGLLYLINAVWVQTKYIFILFWPVNLTCDYSFNAMPLIASLGDVRVLLASATTGGVVWLLWRAFFKGDQRLLFSSVWYVAPMLPATHLVGVIGTLIAERLLYVPLLGWSLLIGEGCRRLSQNRSSLSKVGLAENSDAK